jgi:hypothetical protein
MLQREVQTTRVNGVAHQHGVRDGCNARCSTLTNTPHLHMKHPTGRPESLGRQLLLPRDGLEVEDKKQGVGF